MTLQELMEAAHLDALGLLDDDEQRAFEQAFARAPETVRAQVRAEQARWATTLPELSDAQPPADLRERVLAAVDEAMHVSRLNPAQADHDSEVIATLGVTRGASGARQVARVSPAWRAAALGFATAAAVLLAAFVSMSRQAEQLGQRLQNDVALGALSEGLGAKAFDQTVFAASTRRAVMTATSTAANPAHAPLGTLYAYPERDECRVFAKNLIVGAMESCRVVLVDEQNVPIKELAEFVPTGQVSTHAFALKPVAGLRVALAVAPLGKPALREHVVLVTVI